MLKVEVFEVADKFKNQLSQLFSPNMLPEEDKILQERTRKASAYFIGKIENVFKNKFQSILFETDNKVINKVLNEDIENLQKEVFIKVKCLREAEKGFDAIAYIKSKANADLDFKATAAKKQVKKEIVNYSNIPNAELFSLLKHWRQSTANEMNAPVYMVLPQTSLARLLVELPSTMGGLLKIKGIGKVKAKQFGAEILEIIDEYCLEKGIVREAHEPEKPITKKPIKESTHSITYKKFREGKTVKEIATLQKLTVSTIEGHLALYVGSGEIDVYDMVDKKKVEMIKEFFSNTRSYSISDAKIALGAKVSYADLKYVLKSLKFEV